VITSTANRDIRAVRRLRLAQNRARLGLVLVEGRVALSSVLDAGATIDRLLVTPRASASASSVELQRRAIATGARKLVVSDALMALLCDTATPPAFLAVVPAPAADAPEPRDPWCGLLIGELHDPRALGAILLSAAACRIDAVATTPGAADPWAPKVVRASAAAGWHVPIRARIDGDAWLETLRADGVMTLGLPEGLPGPATLPPRFLLVTGPSVDRLDPTMRIEVAPTVPALPVSVSVSHVLADWSRQHRR